ncbi:hypothetical protein LMG31886_43940 [Xanthomonas hydrangeae]|nr:hypothetical protein LMG31884_45050 [Xanthomonas hydrangeae]CAD7730575.1 hypothetical protein LMG31884_45050 [Xanthomonas hydrangeae]CAD7745684.1 hypothetical protein LMG31887_44970 [Xanthomonas hydrangeae]CAD7745687.1 hypothetical protein LMG31887_44970 [Xanthomonas hydrangeae]CAD7747635.1 hypothetical protein LMG31886_43940 [Xanthomonas hydrangeae]
MRRAPRPQTVKPFSPTNGTHGWAFSTPRSQPIPEACRLGGARRGADTIMATFNLWQWVLVAIAVFAIVLPACLATALIWFGPRHDAPRRTRARRASEASASAPALSLLTGITGDGS